MKPLFIVLSTVLFTNIISAQENQKDSIPIVQLDTVLRITNLSPYITLHVDSVLNYKLDINRKEGAYFWYLRNSPVGLKINRDNGLLSFKAEKSFFLSGKLRYDFPYRVNVGVNNPANPLEEADTSFTLLFYNTEIIPSRIKPSINSVVYVDEGDTLNFKVQCEGGSFPIENIIFYSSVSLKTLTSIKHCDDNFSWSPGFDVVKETDSAHVKVIVLSFVGSTRFMIKDTAQIKVIVREALNYPQAVLEYQSQVKKVGDYILQLKYSFLQLDKSIKKVKNTRTVFDISSSATALTGTILSSSSDASTQKAGHILPSIGVSMVPIKEAVSPQKVYDQNQASLVRTSIKRLEYMLGDNSLSSDRDPDILKKTNKLKEELKQIQVQLIDIPVGLDNSMTEEELNQYFNSPKVNKKYRLKHK